MDCLQRVLKGEDADSIMEFWPTDCDSQLDLKDRIKQYTKNPIKHSQKLIELIQNKNLSMNLCKKLIPKLTTNEGGMSIIESILMHKGAQLDEESVHAIFQYFSELDLASYNLQKSLKKPISRLLKRLEIPNTECTVKRFYLFSFLISRVRIAAAPIQLTGEQLSYLKFILKGSLLDEFAFSLSRPVIDFYYSILPNTLTDREELAELISQHLAFRQRIERLNNYLSVTSLPSSGQSSIKKINLSNHHY